MKRILTGIQSTGIPHLGNILAVIVPGVELSKDEKNESLYFIADMHSVTAVRDADTLRKNTYAVAAAWLAFGFDTRKNIFYRQSDVPEVAELTWYLSCFTPYPMLANAHSFKDKSDRLSEVNAGLFIYPVLMAADIILYDANFVPVGKDQVQHMEITRDIAGTFNRCYGETFIIPETIIDEKLMIVPGTDGQKMSKSYNNTINIFLPEKDLRKTVMSILTDSTPIESPKDTGSCNVFNLYKLMADEKEIAAMKVNYATPGYGYGQAKQALFELIMNKFEKERVLYNELMNDTNKLDEILMEGAGKARSIAQSVLRRVRGKIGFRA
jgi:tryptophanyl-tRNA synthetase